MLSKEVIEELSKIETISYDNGNTYSDINIGQLLIEYAEKEVGSKAFDKFQNFLNTSLTKKGSEELSDHIVNNGLMDSYRYYINICPKDCSELIILKEFRSIVELIFEQFKPAVNNAKLNLKKRIERDLREIINFDIKIELGIIDLKPLEEYVSEKTIVDVNLDGKTAHELTVINEIVTQQFIYNSIIRYTDEFMQLRRQNP